MHRFQTLRYSIYFPLINAVVKSNVAFFTLLFAGNLYVSKIRTSTQVLCERKLTEIFSRSVATVSANRLLQLLSHHRHILRCLSLLSFIQRSKMHFSRCFRGKCRGEVMFPGFASLFTA